MSRVKLLMVLTENETLVGPRDLHGLVDVAVTAEAAGIDGVMMSEHVLLGPDSGAAGEMVNVRDYAAPGNQSPSYAWPSSIVMLSAIAQATTTLRLVAGAESSYVTGAVLVVDGGTTLVDAGTVAFDYELMPRTT